MYIFWWIENKDSQKWFWKVHVCKPYKPINIIYISVSTMRRVTRYNEKKVSLWLLCNDYVSIIADDTSVSNFLSLENWGLKK